MAAVGVLSISLSLFMYFALQFLWNMINALQLAVWLPIFQMQFPGLAALVYNMILQVVTFDLYNTRKYSIDFFDLDLKLTMLNSEFMRIGIDQKIFLAGCGLFALVLLSFVPIIGLVYCLSKFSCANSFIQRFRAKLMSIFVWSFYLRSILESLLELSLQSMIDLQASLLGESWGYTLSFAISILYLGTILALVAFMHFWLIRQNLNDQQLIDKYGSLWDGLLPQPKSLHFQEWFLVRRLILATITFFAFDQLWLSIQALFYGSLVTLAMLAGKPQDSDQAHRNELFNEICLMLIQYILFICINITMEVDKKVLMGNIVAIVSLFNILVNLIIVISVLVISIKYALKRLCNRCRLKSKPKAIRPILSRNKK